MATVSPGRGSAKFIARRPERNALEALSARRARYDQVDPFILIHEGRFRLSACIRCATECRDRSRAHLVNLQPRRIAMDAIASPPTLRKGRFALLPAPDY